MIPTKDGVENPYAAPGADLGGVASNAATRTILLSSATRIGRWRFLAYGWAPALIIVLLLALGEYAVEGRSFDLPRGMLWLLLCVSPFFIMARRRLHDMNRSGWLVPLLILPLLNLILLFILIFVEGNEGINRYGPAPQENPDWVTYASLPLAALTACGMLAAIVLNISLFTH